MAQGVVYLVGAGPGDPGLITVTGRRLLQRADAVVYDKLIDARLLDLAPAEAERVYVGKQAGPGGHCTPQHIINEILIERARAGNTVVRLKGGDPLLFARGAEEAEAVQEAGVRYEIVPGVTAAVAAAATAAIPLTRRMVASAVAMVTGHDDPRKTDLIDWQNLARFPGTLVVYMGLTRIGQIAEALIAHGKEPTTPVALVEWAGSNRQRVATATLAEVTAGPPESLSSPVVAIIGETCRLRGTLGWFEDRPLFGQRVLVTRPAAGGDELSERLEALGAQVICEPVFRIEPTDEWGPVDAAIARLEQFDWVAFSSRNGVEHFLSRLVQLGKDLRRLGPVGLAAIGPGTASSLEDWRLRADIIPEEFRAEALVEAMAPHIAGKRVLLPRADRGRDVLPRGLAERGAQVESVIVYRQADVEKPSDTTLAALRDGAIDWVLFSSSNMARGFFRWLDRTLAEKVRRDVGLIAISPVTSAAVREAGYTVAGEATRYTLDGLVDALVRQVG